MDVERAQRFTRDARGSPETSELIIQERGVAGADHRDDGECEEQEHQEEAEAVVLCVMRRFIRVATRS